MSTLVSKFDTARTLLEGILRQHDGPLTRDLILNPGGFGLGLLGFL